MTAGDYIARIVDVPDHGIRLEPTPDSTTPEQANEVNLLGLAVALALGSAGYQHHPEPRDPDMQTLDALLAGEVTMPWLSATPAGDNTYIVCETASAGAAKCHVEQRPL